MYSFYVHFAFQPLHGFGKKERNKHNQKMVQPSLKRKRTGLHDGFVVIDILCEIKSFFEDNLKNCANLIVNILGNAQHEILEIS